MNGLRVLSFIEGTTLTGPIRPLLAFARHAPALPDGPVASHTIVTTARSADNEFIATARAQGLRLAVLPERRAFDPAVLRGMQQLLADLQPDIVESHSFKPHFLLALLRARLSPQARWLAFHHGYTTESLRVRCYNQLDRYSLPRADRVVTLCQPFADELVRSRGVPASRIAIIKNPAAPLPATDAGSVAALRTELGLASDARVVLAVGRLSSEKNHAGLLAAFAALRRQTDLGDLRLVLVGDGPDRARLQAQAAGLADTVVFAGQRRDVQRFYALAQVFVLPSYSEGSPLVLLEALQAGCPVVATAVGGIPETVTNERSALLVPALPHPQALSAAVARVLREADLRARLVAGGAQVLRHHTIDAYSGELLRIYREMLG